MTIDRLAYFGMGAALGAIAGLLMAPKSGEETRTFLASEATGAATHAVKRAEKAVRHQAENISVAVDAGVQAYREAIQTTP